MESHQRTVLVTKTSESGRLDGNEEALMIEVVHEEHETLW